MYLTPAIFFKTNKNHEKNFYSEFIHSLFGKI